MKRIAAIITFLAMAFSLIGQNTSNTEKLVSISTFLKNAADLRMYIQAAGIATMPAAKITAKGDLYIKYAYQSGSENRAGSMTLQNKGNNRFEGNWKTNADNGNSYQGTLYFIFDEKGLAKGQYQFGGGNYEINIIEKD